MADINNGNKSFADSNIVLIGFMGAGKSTIGRMLAKELGWTFMDTDRMIEEVTGYKIADLFKKFGEVRFRSEERLVVKRVGSENNTVISTGGGTFLDPHNRDLLKQKGIIIHLYVELEAALSRVKNRAERPLLMKSKEDIEALWKNRMEIYDQADLTVDTTNKDIDAITAEILEFLKGGYK